MTSTMTLMMPQNYSEPLSTVHFSRTHTVVSHFSAEDNIFSRSETLSPKYLSYWIRPKRHQKIIFVSLNSSKISTSPSLPDNSGTGSHHMSEKTLHNPHNIGGQLQLHRKIMFVSGFSPKYSASPKRNIVSQEVIIFRLISQSKLICAKKTFHIS